MSTFVDHSDACPKCEGRNLKLIDSDSWGEVYWEKYRCADCGYEFVDVFWYHHSYGEEAADE